MCWQNDVIALHVQDELVIKTGAVQESSQAKLRMQQRPPGWRGSVLTTEGGELSPGDPPSHHRHCDKISYPVGDK